MSLKKLGIAALVLAGGAAAFMLVPDACGCALAPRAGDSVHVAEESAVIVWDAATRTQHFIRRAQFDTQAKDFGFLVPTPSRPVLAEADDDVFACLLKVTRPPPQSEAPKAEMAKSAKMEVAASAPPPRVTVLETAKLAGLDAAVLEANDAQALDRWLRDHGYASSPALTQWFRPYIAASWIITAFKISKGTSQAGRAQTSAVRMSFKTDMPYFPYREPAGGSAGARVLEIYFVSAERVEGRIGTSSQAWPGLTLWAKPLPEAARKELLKRLKLPADALPANAWLTRFADFASPRAGSEDLFFTRAKDQSEHMNMLRLHAELERKATGAAPPLEPPKPVILHHYPVSDPRSQPVEATKVYEQAVQMEKSGDTLSAVRLYRRAARGGSGPAAKRLGDIYQSGVPGIPKDSQEAVQWYELARVLGAGRP